MKGNDTASSVRTSTGLGKTSNGRSDNNQHFSGGNGDSKYCYRAGVCGLKKVLQTSSTPFPLESIQRLIVVGAIYEEAGTCG